MLKITTKTHPDSTTLVLEGRLCRPWTEEVKRGWTDLVAKAGHKKLLLDVEGVTFVDHEGKALLASMLESGTQVRASGVLMRHIVEEARTQASQRSKKNSRGTPDSREKSSVP